MGTLKVWDGTQWASIRKKPGPPGPQGPVASAVTPAGPAGGALLENYPNPVVRRDVAGTLLAVQRDICVDNNWVVIANGAFFMRSGSTPLQITYTPDVDCWWAVDAFVGGIAKDDAAYHYSYLSLNISPNDVDGFDFRQVIYTQHNQVQTYGEREIRHIFNLAAGTTYSCTMSFSANGGTWEYYQASLTCFLTGKAWAK